MCLDGTERRQAEHLRNDDLVWVSYGLNVSHIEMTAMRFPFLAVGTDVVSRNHEVGFSIGMSEKALFVLFQAYGGSVLCELLHGQHEIQSSAL